MRILLLGLACSILGCNVLACSAAATVERNVPPAQAPAERVACTAGTMPVVDGASCAAVGTTSIPKGFEAHPDGWGFRAIKPPTACTGATRAVLGETSCIPLDDCAAAFPPANASVVVVPSGALSLTEAVQGAPVGAVVAVDRGTYTLTETAGMLARPDVRVVGRCSREVIIAGTGKNAAFGVPRGNLIVEGVTLRNFEMAVAVSGAMASAELRHVYFEGNGVAVNADTGARATLVESAVDAIGRAAISTDPIRAVVVQKGAKVDVTDSDVRDVTRAFTAFDKGGEVNVRRTVATSRAVSDDLFLLAMVGGTVTLEESSVTTERTSLLNSGQSRRYAKGASDSAAIRIRKSAIEQRGTYLGSAAMGTMGGATLEIEESTVRHLAGVGITMAEAGTRVLLRSSVLVVQGEAKGQSSFGVSAISGAQLTVDGTAIVGAKGVGVGAYDEGTKLTFTRSLVTGTVTAPSLDEGSVTSLAVLVANKAHATFEDSAIADNEQSGLVVGAEGSVEAQGLVVEGTTTSSGGALGEGVYVDLEATLVMRGSAICKNAWIGLVVMRGGGVVESTRFEDNASGAVNVWETAVSRPAVAGEPKARELALIGNTFRASLPEVQEGEVEVILPTSPGEGL